MTKSKFVDRLRVFVKAGAGGCGHPAKQGKGGDGGSVIFETSGDLAQDRGFAALLKSYPKKRIAAGPGGNASRLRILGTRGSDTIVPLPPGVRVRLDNGVPLGDLDAEGDRVVAAAGGRGGDASSGFAARPAERRSVVLDLKLIADVGFVGFPNAGKSSLLRALSKAKPKVAAYPFTTLRPNVGEASFPDARSFTLADLPGLVEGANQNIGLGHRFLRHVERTSLLLFVLDITGFQFKANLPWRSPEETALCLARELQLYRPDLADKPAICAVNKVDLCEAEAVAEAVANLQDLAGFVGSLAESMEDNVVPPTLPAFREVIAISAKEGHNVDLLKHRLRFWLDEVELARTEQDRTDSDDAFQRKLRTTSEEHLKSLV